MGENYMDWGTYESLSHDEIPRWVDAHSVTCALCGALADERETVSLWSDEKDGSSGVNWDEYPEGEAHQSCFERTQDGEKPKSGWADSTRS